MAEFPTYKEMGKKVAEEALDGYIYKGKTLREWVDVIVQAQWIPVSERLPDEWEKCLVTFKNEYVGIMCYVKDLYKVDEYDFCTKKGKAGWYDYDNEWGYYSRDDVIAWMPLPEPYGAESEE